MAAPIVIYTTAFCPYCHGAKRLLDQKGAAYEEIAVDGNRAAREAMSERAGGRTTVPQIFFGDEHIGGCEDLYALEKDGALDGRLKEVASG